jgi:hypothetical protein
MVLKYHCFTAKDPPFSSGGKRPFNVNFTWRERGGEEVCGEK